MVISIVHRTFVADRVSGVTCNAKRSLPRYLRMLLNFPFPALCDDHLSYCFPRLCWL